MASGGDPDAVTNATLQLRSEYGDLWVRIRQGFTLADLDTRQVKQAEDWYAARPDYVARMVDRGRRYSISSSAKVEKRGMPAEIALLPRSKAPTTRWPCPAAAPGNLAPCPRPANSPGPAELVVDERRDVIAATDSALDYLQKLYAEFVTGIRRWPRPTGRGGGPPRDRLTSSAGFPPII